MNPGTLFSLTPGQRQLYQIQPDDFSDINWNNNPDEYELPPYIGQSTLRFWYNTQDFHYFTHWHNAQEIVVPLEEGYCVTVQDITYRLEPGDILLIPPGELHSLESPRTGSRFIFLLELDLFGHLGDFPHTRSYLAKPVHITSDTCPQIYEKEISLIMQIAGHYWGNSSVKQMHIYGCLMEFYACYTDYCTSQGSPASAKAAASLPKQTSQKLNVVLSYMEQHYSEKITLESAAETIHLSKFYFTRAFKQYTGQTFYDYLNLLRIRASEDLLINTANPIPRIAAACGFFSVSSFNRCFRKVKGCTPSEFRSLYGHGM